MTARVFSLGGWALLLPLLFGSLALASEKPVCPSVLLVSKKDVSLLDEEGLPDLRLFFETFPETPREIRGPEKIRAKLLYKGETPSVREISVGETIWIYDCMYRLKKTESRGLFLEKILRLE